MKNKSLFCNKKISTYSFKGQQSNILIPLTALSSLLFEQLFNQFKNIKRCTIIDLVIGILFGVSQPSIAPWHFQSCTVDKLSFYACSRRNSFFQAWLSDSKFHMAPPYDSIGTLGSTKIIPCFVQTN